MDPIVKWLRWIVPPLLALAVIAALWPMVNNDFVNWGDQNEIALNEHLRRGWLAGARWSLTTIHMGHYQPLTWLTLLIDCGLWGAGASGALDPSGFHLTSLLIHAAVCVAVYALIRRLMTAASGDMRDSCGRILIAAFAALVFALHPLRIESVAWASERRGPLSALFCVLAVLAYLKGARDPALNRKWRTATLACFLLALLAKETALVLPLILLILDVHPLRRTESGLRSRLLEKWPLLALSAVWAVIAAMSARQSQVIWSWSDHGPLDRAAQACAGLTFLLAKSLWPAPLSPLYELRGQFALLSWTTAVNLIVLAALALMAWGLRRRAPALPVIALACVALMLPVSGLAQTGHQWTADRYAYLPAIAMSAGLAGGALLLWRRIRLKVLSGAVIVASVSLLVMMIGQAREQMGVWRDSISLWSHAVKVDPESAIAHHNFGAALAEAGQFDAAILHLELAGTLDPAAAHAQRSLRSLRNWRNRSMSVTAAADLEAPPIDADG